MNILIAEDDATTRRTLIALLTKWGYTVTACRDGAEAWERMQADGAPALLILDWMMPRMDGLQVCRKVRAAAQFESTYVILLTAKERGDDIVAGLQAGADDYVTKPFDREELQARVQVGLRVIELQHKLADRVSQLESALTEVRQLGGLLPICSYCKKIRNDENYWQQVETYISDHSDAQFSHSVCPGCYDTATRPLTDRPELRRPHRH